VALVATTVPIAVRQFARSECLPALLEAETGLETKRVEAAQLLCQEFVVPPNGDEAAEKGSDEHRELNHKLMKARRRLLDLGWPGKRSPR
jgi:hypothetical protein